MEIDLEVPSHEQDKLPNANADNSVLVDGVDIEGETNSPSGEHATEACGPDVNEGADCGVNQVDSDASGADVVSRVDICEPKSGLEFETKEEAYSFYREYARYVGFGITIKASRRSKISGKFIDVKIACSRFGSKRESHGNSNPRSCEKTDCKAGMHMKRRPDGKWFIHNFVREHNHEICREDYYKAVLGRKKHSDAVACQKKGLQLALDEDDVQVMLEHFICMQAENPNFFYAVDLDKEKHMRNVLWVDPKGRHDYSIFSDVVFVDTFYVKSKYRIPYVQIIGVNHHFQFLLLGCAFIEELSTSTCLWLMRAWNRAMGGQAPKVIISDQDKFLDEAIADAFPNTKHCYCLWHVLDKMAENLSPAVHQSETFMAKFNKCIYKSWTDEQFEKRWRKMLDNFELRENSWLHSLHEDCKKWAPTYMRDIFLAGMSTTERSASIASFFDKYIHREATFKEFFEQYKAFLRDRNEMEVKADFETLHKQHVSRSLSAFEEQMSAIYTDAIFKKFQVEVLGAVSCHLQKEDEGEVTVTFRVDDFEERQNFLVVWNEEALDIHCLCRSFEYRGFLCKHAILVLQMSGVSNIPLHCILKRWTKDARVSQMVNEISDNLHCRAERFNDLCKRAIKLAEGGSLSQEAYDIAFHALEEALKECVDVNSSVRNVLGPSKLAVQGFPDTEEENHIISMAKSSKKKKYKKKQVHSEPETITIDLQDSQQENGISRAETTDSCYVPQQVMQEMELGSRIPALDAYYSSQQSIVGVGQLSPFPPFFDGYYGNQQGLASMGQSHSTSTRLNQYGSQQSMLGAGQVTFRAPTLHGGFNIHESLQDDMEQSVSSAQFNCGVSKNLHNKYLSR